MNPWTELCQKNVNHYNDNPVAHIAALAVYTAGALVVCSKLIRKLSKNEPRSAIPSPK